MNTRSWKRYWYRALWVSWWLRFVPFVRMVGLNGSMATGTVHEGSDIDFYIVIEPGYVYTGRFLVTGMVQVLGLRRHGSHVAGRICLNRYATADFLDITEHNEYHARVFHNLFPLFDADEHYAAYTQANSWMKGYGFPVSHNRVVFHHTWLTRSVQATAEFFFGCFSGIERALRAYQQRRIWADTKAVGGKSIVVTTDQELRFHLDKELYG